MVEPRRSLVVDTRGGEPFALPAAIGVPEPEPRVTLLAGNAEYGALRAPVAHHPGATVIAGMPVPDEGTRTERRAIDFYHVFDVSPSNDWTDPQQAKFLDFAFVARKWASRYLRADDRFIQVLFDSQAAIYPPCAPRDVPKDGWRHRPTPSAGGTQFVPPMHAVAAHADGSPERAKQVIMYTDGMGDDVFEANAILVRARIDAVLIPYGSDFPWIGAGWEHSAFRLARHVGEERRAIAQTVALAILLATGHERIA